MGQNLSDLEMARKRNRKIRITEEAIKKVPRIKYKNIPENEYQIIQYAILSERLEEQLKAVDWAKEEQKRILKEKGERLSKELMEKMTPFILASSKTGLHDTAP